VSNERTLRHTTAVRTEPRVRSRSAIGWTSCFVANHLVALRRTLPGEASAPLRNPLAAVVGSLHTVRMTPADIDSYLAGVEEPKRSMLEQLRQDILAALPHAEECISYGMPAFKVEGKTVAGFAAFKNHLSYLPHSGSVLDALEPDLAGYEYTKGSLHFPIDKPLPTPLVRKLLTTRLAHLGLQGSPMA